jgi:6-phosphogluconolactonase
LSGGGAASRHLWVGGYTPTMGGTAEGIGLLRVGSDGDGIEFLGTVIATSSPSFLASGGGGNSGDGAGGAGAVLYATDEAGRVESFRRGPGFTLLALGGRATSGGFPCHLSVTPDALYVSNYADGSIDVFPLTGSPAAGGGIGALRQTLASSGSGPNPAQDGPHAHSTLVVDGSILSADLGADRVHVHSLEGGSLVRGSSVALPPGTGPRDLLAQGAGTILLGELSGAVFALDGHGEVIARGAVADSWVDGDHAAALAVDSTGTFAYTGLRGSNRIAVVRLSDLSPVAAVSCAGDWPRHLCVLPDESPGAGRGDLLLVANERSSTVSCFRIDPTTGIPRPIGSPAAVASPTFLLPVL